MKVGDLVNFESGVVIWTIDYLNRNPGIIIRIRRAWPHPDSAHVVWSNGDQTTEHASYLRILDTVDDSLNYSE